MKRLRLRLGWPGRAVARCAMHVAGGAGASLIEKVKVRSGLAGGGSRLRTIGPSRKESRFRALITRNSLTITPLHFRLGSIPYASRESREQ